MAMTSTSLPALVKTESGNAGITSLQSALRRDDHAGHRTPSAYELERLTKTSSRRVERHVPSTPQSPWVSQDFSDHHGDLETSRPPSPFAPVEIMPSLKNPSMNRWRFVAALACFFANGMNDASTGAIIPLMEAHYGISYGVVSIIFVGNAFGFIVAATYTNWLHQKVGRANHMLLAQLALIAGYSIIVAAPPFWLVCIGFFLTGTGMAVSMAPINVFVCGLANSTSLLGILHGVYGVGGTISPLIATAMTDSGIQWSYFYGIMLGISVINTFGNYWTNRGYEQDKPSALLANLDQSQSVRHQDRDWSNQSSQVYIRDATAGSSDAQEQSTSMPTSAHETPANVTPSWKQTMSRTTIFAACFIFAYQGGEVSISGWVLSFLLAYRKPPYATVSPPHSQSGYNPLGANEAASRAGSLGYVTSGFWGGLTLARLFATTFLSTTLGESLSIVVLMALSATFQLLVWLVPNLIAESVVIAILGAILGPVYPLSTAVFARLLDRKVQTSSLSVITAMGSSGGAVLPLLVGLTSQGVGVWVLHPICLGAYAMMAVCWLGLNWGRTKRSD